MPNSLNSKLMLGLVILILFLPLAANAQIGLETAPALPPGSNPRDLPKGDADPNLITSAILAALLKGFSRMVLGINYLIGLFGGMFFALGGAFIQLGLALNNNIISSPIVQVGWVITRDLANLGFVVAIIYIAFATILRLAGHNTKQLLFRLLVAALLINFSLTIVSYLIGAGDILSKYFINKVTPTSVGQTNNFAVNLANVFQIQKLLEVKKSQDLPDIKGGVEFGGAILGLIASMFFVAFFTSIAALTILTIAFMIFARYVALSILIILMPMAWLLWIFPYFSGQFKAWWSKFISWLIFLPVATFFIYLTILMVTNYAQDAASVNQLSQQLQLQAGTFLDKFLATVATPLATVSQMVVIIGLLLAGLKAANVSGEQAAGIAIGWAEKAHGWMTGRIKGAGRLIRGEATQRFWRRTVAEEEREGGKIPVSRAEYWNRRLSRIPGLRGVASTLGGYMKKTGPEAVDDYVKTQLDVLSDEAIVERTKRGWLQRTFLTSRVEAAALAVKAAKEDLFGKIEKEAGKEAADFLIDVARRFGKTKEITANRPDLGPRFGQSIESVMSKIKAEKADDISAEAFKIQDVVLNLNPGHLKRLARTANEKQRMAIEETIKKAMTENFAQWESKERSDKLTKEEQRLFKNLKDVNNFIKTSPQWQA